jgi:hypothetical protein
MAFERFPLRIRCLDVIKKKLFGMVLYMRVVSVYVLKFWKILYVLLGRVGTDPPGRFRIS